MSKDSFAPSIISCECQNYVSVFSAGDTDVNVQEVWSRYTTHHPVDAVSIADTMRLLINHGTNVASQDETHSTPLHLAAFWCNVEAVRLLIEHGDDVLAQDGNHRTPLHLALLRASVKTSQP